MAAGKVQSGWDSQGLTQVNISQATFPLYLRMYHIPLLTPNKWSSPQCGPYGLTPFTPITSLASPAPQSLWLLFCSHTQQSRLRTFALAVPDA